MKFTAGIALSALLGAAAAAKDQRTFAVLHFTNKQLTIARADPIVSPGDVGSHVHHILGGSNFGLNSTGEDLLKSNCSTAQVKGDNSNYWFPSLYFKDPKTGDLEAVELFYANVYYFFEPTNDDIKAFPVGLQMVSGNVAVRTPPAAGATSNLDPSNGPVQPIKWTCPRSDLNSPGWPADSNGLMAGMQDPRNKGEGVGFPDVNCDGYASPLRADVHFPSCYNPSAGLTDHKNNMAWPENNNGKQDCPKGYIHVPHIFYEAYWNTPLFADRWQQGQGQQPFVLANGDATGYSSHADFMSGWDEKLLQHVIDTCNTGTTGMENCPGLFYGKNTEQCTIDSPVDEQVTGVLSKLPGNNPITGWAYGQGNESPQPGQSQSSSAAPAPSSSQAPSASSQSSSASATSTTETPVSSQTSSQTEASSQTQVSSQTDVSTQPASTSASGSPVESSAPAQSQTDKPSSTLSASPVGSSDICTTRKTHTIYKTVTVYRTGTAPASPTATATGAEVEGFKYAGCFKDSQDRTLSGSIRPDIGRMSNEKCVSECKKLGFSVAGTEYGGQCYCGNELVGSEHLEESACDMVCEDNASSKCGGSWALSVYSDSGEVSLKNTQRRRHIHEHLKRHSGRL